MYIKEKELFLQDSQAEQVLYSDELEVYIKSLNLKQIFLYFGVDSDSGLEVDLPESKFWDYGPSIDKETLWILISNLRVIKTED
jgi:hypothetical protein